MIMMIVMLSSTFIEMIMTIDDSDDVMVEDDDNDYGDNKNENDNDDGVR